MAEVPATQGIAPDAEVGIIGAGIIGVASAFELSRQGYRVTLFDQDQPGRFGPSFGNAGHIAGSDIFPLSKPGIERTALRMLADRDGPLKLSASHLPKSLPWLWNFWRSGRGDNYLRSIRALTAISADAVESTETLFAQAGIADKLQRKAALYLYESDRSYDASKADWAEKASNGRASITVDDAAIRDLEPDLAPLFRHGVLSQEWALVSDPYDVVTGLAKAAQRMGVNFECAKVERIAVSDTGAEIFIDGKPRSFDAVLIAAGVWSRGFAAQLGEALPLEAERGYNLTYPDAPVRNEHPLVFADRGIVSTTLTSGLRIGGWAEYAGLRAPAGQTYFLRLHRICRTLFPGIDDKSGIEWMGPRPSLPDSVPVLSRSARAPRIFYACGHGHYGLTQAAKSANLITDLISGKAADDDLALFSIRRFS
ncbi:FAD-binding oxidoreductase [Pelagibius sp. Alg239-R121]|uniref:NAD(P)/FAD-dependent oxidoreductase n=1 Tax=Pelagibius sp. Alg239-R121 TaxID=2993448 RepID=UPI0024A6C512|nr:FAD-dependent oxidoreductase [Pelagibius sp. Alg239-R121]